MQTLTDVRRQTIFVIIASIGLAIAAFDRWNDNRKVAASTLQASPAVASNSIVEMVSEVAERMAYQAYTAPSIKNLVDSLSRQTPITWINEGQAVDSLKIIGVAVFTHEAREQFDEVVFYIPASLQAGLKRSELEARFGTIEKQSAAFPPTKSPLPAVIIPRKTRYPPGLRLQVYQLNGAENPDGGIYRLELFQTKQ